MYKFRKVGHALHHNELEAILCYSKPYQQPPSANMKWKKKRLQLVLLTSTCHSDTTDKFMLTEDNFCAIAQEEFTEAY